MASPWCAPIHDELYRPKKQAVTSRRSRGVLTIATGTASRPARRRPFSGECKALMGQVAGIRRTGSAAIDLAWVAAGRFDGYAEHDLGPWDMAAGALLVREAGGHATDMDGGRNVLEGGGIVAGNATVQRALLDLLAGARQGI
jgi:myo-inositol-1(or 4)-monophosphatase